jgi:nitrate/TMAO reductase-like tetraheme cytochrome c subunit
MHYQNKWVPKDEACFTCHTQYAMFGDMKAKLNGFKHLLVNYVGTIPEEIELYAPYQNRECLHCHGDARSFEESELHVDFIDELRGGETSCLECHDLVHAVSEIESLDKWDPEAVP